MGGGEPGAWEALARFEFGAGLLHVRSDLPNATDGSFTPWSDRYHGLVLRVPGIRRVRRFELVGAFAAGDTPGSGKDGQPSDPTRFLTLYDLKHPGVLDTPEFRALAAIDAGGTAPSPLARELNGTRLVCRERRRWPSVSIARLFPAGDKLLHLAVGGEDTAVERWLTSEAVPALLPAVGAVGVRWFDAGEGRHIVVCELQGPLWPLPPSVTTDLGPAVWSAYRQEYMRNAPGE
ncbi:hypothetical protein LO772_26170 [Yinghuangia sp. ASG 101]|uniref:hypothetical protein n=1 Tax=Yinghuangia sp. ASG 101 TaxID=2896848 RepID=UPI001E37F704|nr:hypothetical protein [Yinghuangia sp. ASG 101]UGQ10326.1 hypothetical protein LO772_26170 [Yinghuangia sp. ASG 101]